MDVINLEFIKKISVENKAFTLPLFALLSFLTWYFKVPEIINMGIYISIFLLLFFLKASNLTLVMFMLFTAPANRIASFLPGDKPFTFLYISVFIVFALTSIYKLIRKKSLPKGKLVLPMVAIFAYALISLLWTVDKVGGLSEISIIIQGYLAYVMIKNDEKSKISYYELSWFLTLITLVISLQYFVITYKHLPFDGKFILVDNFWAYINLVAAVIGVSFVPSLYKYFAKGKSKWTFLYLPLELFVIYAIYVSKSEGLYFSLIVGSIFTIILIFFKNKKILYWLSLTMVAGFFISIVTIVLLKDTYPTFYEKIDFFSSNRIDLYRLALIEVKNPILFIFGKGAGSAHKLLEPYYPFYYYHSWVFQLLVQRGLITIIAFMYMLYLATKTLSKSRSNFKYFVAIGIVIYLSHSIIDLGFEYQFIGVIVYMMFAIVENKTFENNYIE